jgi:hypothetical protein
VCRHSMIVTGDTWKRELSFDICVCHHALPESVGLFIKLNL